jgi:hypothetical protein
MVQLNKNQAFNSQPTGFNQANTQFQANQSQTQAQFQEQPSQNQANQPKGLISIPPSLMQIIP